jgi:hypothetical protein
MNRQEQPEATLVINIDITPRLIALMSLALVIVATLGYLVRGQGKAVASSPRTDLAASSGTRQYYLTRSATNGANASTACANGYHFASLWEILDPTNLDYNADLGRTRDDSGAGPPTYDGWVRTGYSSNNDSTAGQANCNVWSTTSGNGTRARMTSDWTGTKHIHVWFVGTMGCSSTRYVWCVED